MTYDQQDAGASTLLHPLNIDVATLGQPDPRSFTSPRSHANLPRHQDGDTFQVSVPGGASILMKDSAGTSMSLNLGIDPSSGTPILSGRAIDAHGGVLDVHPCSCSDPISPHHKLPGTPEHARGGMHLRDHTHSYPSSKSPFGVHRRLVPTPTPLIVVQTLEAQMVYSPSRPEHRGCETPGMETSVDALRSPFTPTPASMQRPSSPSSDPQEGFHTPPLGPEDTSTPSAVQALESSPDSLLSSGGMALALNTIPDQSIFEPDCDTPLVQSPSADSVQSEPSAIGPLESFPSTPSHDSEFSTRTVVPLSRPVHGVQLHVEVQPNTESNDLLLDVSALPSPSGGSNHPANVDTLGSEGLSITQSDSHSTDRVIADPLSSMPVARVGPDGDELRYNLETQPRFSPIQVRPVTRSGNLGGKWVANLHQDKMALTLDLSLDGLGIHNLSLSVPTHLSLSSDEITAPEARQQESARQWDPPVVDRWETSSELSQSVVSIGSSPSIAPPLSDLPLTPIPELLHTPTPWGHSTPGTAGASVPSPRASAFLSERRHPQSRVPGPLDSSPILEELAQGESNVSAIRGAMRGISRKWQNIQVMPDGVSLRAIDDAGATLYDALVDLAPVITLTWPTARQPSLGTDGGQPYTAEFQLQLQNMGDVELKWYLKQHEFTASVQRNLTRLALLAQRVREDPDAAYRGNVYKRISQFAAKFQDIALRLKLAHHIRVEQKYRARVRHSSRRAVASPEQAAALECHKTQLIKARGEIEKIKRTLLSLCDGRPVSL